MKTFSLNREIPLDERFDVIVVGGGPAGCTAAVAAAREGARTLLLEASGALGGMGTSGLVPAWCPFTDHEKIIYRGLAERVLRACLAQMPHLRPDQFDWAPIDPEALKTIYDDLLTEAGATVRFHTMLCGVQLRPEADADGNRAVDAIIASSKAGLTAYRAKVYIDCSGDADLAAWAGAPFEMGGEDHELQPATHCFTLSNVDVYAYEHVGGIRYCKGREAIRDILASGKYPLIEDLHACNSLIGPGVVGFNAGHIWNVDPTDPDCVSRALMRGRKIAHSFRDACAEFSPAFRNAFLSQTADALGIRESRRIVGDYVLTEDDYLARRSFPDEICRNAYYLDVHGTRPSEKSGAGKAGEAAVEKRQCRYGPGESHGVPYRCLIPKTLRNVLVAGRTISTTRVVQGTTRVMPVCLCMGEACGVAASMAAAQAEPDVRAVEAQRLRARLREHGAWLPE